MIAPPVRLPDAASLQAILAGPDPASVDAALVPALATAFPSFDFSLAKDGGDVKATWQRLKDTDLQITEWRGASTFVFAPTGPAAADYVQIALGREIEWRAGPVVKAQRVRLPHPDAAVLLRWAERTYGF